MTKKFCDICGRKLWEEEYKLIYHKRVVGDGTDYTTEKVEYLMKVELFRGEVPVKDFDVCSECLKKHVW